MNVGAVILKKRDAFQQHNMKGRYTWGYERDSFGCIFKLCLGSRKTTLE